MLTAIAQGTLYPILFGYFDFTGGIVRICTHNQEVTWDGHAWAGLGTLVGMAPMQENKNVEATGMAFSLNGVPSDLITEVLTARSRGRTCRLYLGLFDSSGALLNDPFILFSGRMDQPQIQDGGDNCNITITAESRMVDLQRPRNGRYTNEDQLARYAGDFGLEFVAGLQSKEIKWGSGTSTTNPSANSPSGALKPSYKGELNT
jgi:hypothetical protein